MGCGSEGAWVGEGCVAIRRRGAEGRLGMAFRVDLLGGLLNAGARKSRYSGRRKFVDGRLLLYGREAALKGFDERTAGVRAAARRHDVHMVGAGAMAGECWVNVGCM